MARPHSGSTRATVIDVAAAAGVGPSTVSRFLRGTRIRPELAERVDQAVRALGYEPDAAARSLRGGRSLTLGVLFPRVSNAFFGRALQRIEEHASRMGYTVTVMTHHDDPDKQRKDMLTLRRCRVEGVILTALPHSTLADVRGVLLNEPIVALDSFFSPEVDSILLDNRRSSALATSHFIEHGFTRIACLAAKPGIFSYAERIMGYVDEMKSRGLETDLIVAEDYDALGTILAERFTGPGCPEAVLALSDAAVLRFLQQWKISGRPAPQRPKLIGFDDFPHAPFLDVPLTVVRQPVDEMIDAAVASLVHQIGSPGIHTPQTNTLAGELVLRSSCGCS